MAKQIRWLPPTYTKMETGRGQIVLHMDGVVSAADNQGEIHGFAIAGKDRRFQPATAEWQFRMDRNNRPQRDRSVLVLTSPHVPEPIHFRYAWGRNPMANLQSADHNDLPFATQRSDDWKMENVPLGVLGDEPFPGGKMTRAQRGRIRDVLRKEDLLRRLAEAQALLKQHGALLDEASRDK
jgi:sialate O-acetylesterase